MVSSLSQVIKVSNEGDIATPQTKLQPMSRNFEKSEQSSSQQTIAKQPSGSRESNYLSRLVSQQSNEKVSSQHKNVISFKEPLVPPQSFVSGGGMIASEAKPKQTAKAQQLNAAMSKVIKRLP